MRQPCRKLRRSKAKQSNFENHRNQKKNGSDRVVFLFLMILFSSRIRINVSTEIFGQILEGRQKYEHI